MSPNDAGDSEDYDCPTCGRTFGSERGLQVHRGRAHPSDSTSDRKQGLVEDLRRIAADLGEPPTSTDLRHGDYDTASVPTFRKYFDTWNDALRAAGFPIHEEQETDPEALLADLQRVADELGRPPARTEYEDIGEFSSPCYRNHFGSWNNAMEEAGFGVNWEPVDSDALLADIERLADELGRVPQQPDVRKHGKFSVATYHRHFGGWNAALENVGLEPILQQNISKDELLADLRHVDDAVDGRPSRSDYGELGKFSYMPFVDRFGSWDAAVQAIGHEPYADLDLTGPQHNAWKGGCDGYYGPNWVQQRRRARKRDGYTCQVCGMTDEEHKGVYGFRLEVHHIIPVRTFRDDEGELDHVSANALDNLITMCRADHARWEGIPLRPEQAD